VSVESKVPVMLSTKAKSTITGNDSLMINLNFDLSRLIMNKKMITPIMKIRKINPRTSVMELGVKKRNKFMFTTKMKETKMSFNVAVIG